MKKDAERAENDRQKDSKRKDVAPKKLYCAPIKKVDTISRDPKIYTFRLPGQQGRLGLPIGQHIQMVHSNDP